MRCPECGSRLDEDNYCWECAKFFNEASDDYSSEYCEPDYDLMVNNGEEICLNCTFWSVSPYGMAHGMYCRKGNGETDPDDTCFEFVKTSSFGNYGDEGQFQFDETSQEISNKLYYWKNSR